MQKEEDKEEKEKEEKEKEDKKEEKEEYCIKSRKGGRKCCVYKRLGI